MNLFLIRHAIATPHASGSPDEARALTPAGRERFQAIAAGLSRLGVRFDRIVHSPLLRAVQTAELLADLGGELQVDPRLSEAVTPTSAAGLLSLAVGENTAYVGHEPWLSDLFARFLGRGRRGAAFSGVALWKKGGVAWLSGSEPPQAGQLQLVAFLPPRVLRRLV